MAIQKSFGYTAETATKSLTIPDIDWDGGGYATTSKTASSTIVTNTTSPLDQPESMRWACQGIKNIYTGTQIDPSYFATSRRGISVLTQVNDILRVTDSSEPLFRVDLPVSTHLVVRTALSNYLSADDVLSVVLRAVSALFDNGVVTSSRLEQLLRGGSTPANL